MIKKTIQIIREALPEMFGGLMLALIIYLFTEFKKLEILYKVVLIFIILTLTVIFYLYAKKKKNLNKRIASKLGFLIRRKEVDVDLELNGGFTYKSFNEIEAFKDNFHSRSEKLLITGDTSFKKLNIQISSKSESYKIDHEIVATSKQFIKVVIKFSPALKKGEIIDYEIRYQTKAGLFTRYEDVVGEIKAKRWPFTEPYEYMSTSVRYPTDSLKFSMRFPKNYHFSGRDFWDITLIDDYERIEKLHQLLSKKEAFKKFTDRDGHIVVSIEDNKPIMNTRYYLKFIPPSSSDAE